MGNSGDLTDAGPLVDDAQTLELVVVETFVVWVIQWWRKKLGAAQTIGCGSVFYFLEGNEQAALVRAHCLDGEIVFLLSLAAMEHLAHREADFGLVGGGFDAQLAFDSVRFDDTADH